MAEITLAEQLAPFQGHLQDLKSDDMPAKEGTPAKYERGVLYQGPWEVYADGFCEHVRRCARALHIAGVPTHLRSSLPRFRNPRGEDRLVDEQYGDLLRASIAVYAAQVQQVVPAPDLLTRLVSHRYYSAEELAYINARRVISTVWERQSGMNQEDVDALNRCGQAWVGTEAAKELLVGAGVEEEKVRWVPCPYLDDDPHLALNGRKRRPGPLRFYHIGKWEPRKGQDNIMGAFLCAFKPGEAMLLLKTSERAPDAMAPYPATPAEALRKAVSCPGARANGWAPENIGRGVVIMDRLLSTEQMLELHRIGDVYVTLSRGEGFDMPAFDAKLSGNLMVYTPSGGPQGFAGEHDERVEQSGTVPCHPFYRWPEDSEYLDYRFDDAVAAMQRAAAKVLGGKRERGIDLAPGYSALSVGKRMRGFLEELAEKLV